jgi:flavodoxin
MKALVIFDSNFGNTKLVADSIARGLGGARAVSVKDFKSSDLAAVKLLIVGSPIIGWKPTEKMIKFLSTLKKGRLNGVKAAAFDTRIKMFISGNAARKISSALKNAGAEIIIEPKGFFVRGKEGPLLDGEIKNAGEWAKSIKSRL